VSKLLKACLQRTQTLQFKVQHANYTRLPSHPLPTDNKQLPCGHQRREALVPGASSRRRRLSMSKGACLSVSVCLSVCLSRRAQISRSRTDDAHQSRSSLHPRPLLRPLVGRFVYRHCSLVGRDDPHGRLRAAGRRQCK